MWGSPQNPHPPLWTGIGGAAGVWAKCAVSPWQPELAACQATCLGVALQRSLPEAFNQEIYCLGAGASVREMAEGQLASSP